MSFSQAHTAVQIEGVVGPTWRLGNGEGSRMGKLIARPNDEAFVGVFGTQRRFIQARRRRSRLKWNNVGGNLRLRCRGGWDGWLFDRCSKRPIRPIRHLANYPPDGVTNESLFVQRLIESLGVIVNDPIPHDLIGRAEVDNLLRAVKPLKLNRSKPSLESLFVDPTLKGVKNSIPNVTFNKCVHLKSTKAGLRLCRARATETYASGE